MGWFDRKPDAPAGAADARPATSPSQGPVAPPQQAGPAHAQPAPPPVHAAPAAHAPPPQHAPEPEPNRASLASVIGNALSPSRPAPGAPALAAPSAGNGASVFAETVDIQGSLEGDGDVILRGQVRGSIHISGTLIVGESGRVQADVVAREVVNAGTVEGNIAAREKVRVQSTGVVHGDIDSPSIVIDDGGGVEGFVQMEPPGGEDEDDELPAPAPRPEMAAAGRLTPRPLAPRPWQVESGAPQPAASLQSPTAHAAGLGSGPPAQAAAAPLHGPSAIPARGPAAMPAPGGSVPPAAGLLRPMGGSATPAVQPPIPAAAPLPNPLGDPLDVFAGEGDEADATLGEDVLGAGPLGGNGAGGNGRAAEPRGAAPVAPGKGTDSEPRPTPIL